jgi:hypothetical protein
MKIRSIFTGNDLLDLAIEKLKCPLTISAASWEQFCGYNRGQHFSHFGRHYSLITMFVCQNFGYVVAKDLDSGFPTWFRY